MAKAAYPITSLTLRGDGSWLRRGLWLSLAGAAIVLTAFIDVRILGVSPIAEGPPRFDAIFLLRTALAGFASVLFVVCFAGKRNLSGAERFAFSEGLGDAGDRLPGYSGRLSAVVALCMSVSFVVVFVANAQVFFELAAEDGPIETLSVVLLITGAASFVGTSCYLRRKTSGWTTRTVMVPLLLALLLFLIAMEELSWGQRILSLRTPGLLSANLQQETNLHNLATNMSENVYYFGAFTFLVAMPFVVRETSLFGNRRSLPMVVPSRLVMVLAALPVAFNYDMWNIVATQFAFFTMLLILAREAWAERHARRGEALLAPAVLLVCVATQLIFIALGERSVRVWDVTEYKELLISMMLALFSMQVLERAKTRA